MDHTSVKLSAVIAIVDPEREADWPTDTPAGIRRYLSALAGKGPAHFVTNAAGVAAQILRVGDKVLPLLVSDGAAGKASILSPFGHHLSYPIEEISRQSKWLPQPVLRLLLSPLSLAFRLGRLDRVVLVNHWMLSGAPSPDVPNDAWRDVIAFLSARFPSHALVIQDIKPELEPVLAAALGRAGGLAVPTRLVQIIDPKDTMPGKAGRKKRYHRIVARRIAESWGADLAPPEVARSQPERLAELYRASNINRHSSLNPGYRPAFFDLALGCGEFHMIGWRDQAGPPDRIVAFNLQRHDATSIHWSTFGCEEPPQDGRDRSGPSHYERVTAADIVAAEEGGLLLDWGAGADEFKRLRGAVAHQQVEFAFVGHLALHRRAVWHLLAWLRRLRAEGQKPVRTPDLD